MSGRKSKNKGSKWERDCCKLLKEWTKSTFERTKLSGGGNAKGDIYPAYDSFDFIVECKHTENWDHEHFFTKNGPIFNNWIPKLLEERIEAKRKALLLIKRNNKKPLAILEITNKVSNILSDYRNDYITMSFLDVRFIVIKLDLLLETDGTKFIK